MTARNEYIVHECPTSHAYDNRLILKIEDVDDKGLRCGCKNRDCWVYQYTQSDRTKTEHKGA